MYLDNEFLNNYSDFPEHMTELGKFTFLRTYSRVVGEEGSERRETYKEAVARATNYNVGLVGDRETFEAKKFEAQAMFHSVYNLNQFPSGRTMWVGGAESGAAEKHPTSQFNCFTGDTQFMTRGGIKSFNEFKDGAKVKVLNESGMWVKAKVRNFGPAKIVILRMEREGKSIAIRTTENHRWLTTNGDDSRAERTTVNLNEGDKLAIAEMNGEPLIDSPWVVQEHYNSYETEDVWCVEEPQTETFALFNGVLTKNCSYTKTESWGDLSDLFYMLMVGTGVGFRCSVEMANKLAPLYRNISYSSTNSPAAMEDRIEFTETHISDDNELTIVVGDSKEGWVQALTYYFQFLSQTWLDGEVGIILDVSNVRPAGEKLKTFGGRASGPQPLIEMFEAITQIITGEFYHHDGLGPSGVLNNSDYVHLRPVHVLDIGNFIGNNVVVGGVRRTAEIFICDPDDYESIFAKFGINGIWGQEGFDKLDRIEEAAIAAGVPLPGWWEDIKVRHYQLEDGAVMLASDMEEQPINLVNAVLMNPGRPHHHRRMSNNSIGFIDKPSKEYLNFVFELMQSEGEPGFINLYEAASRRLGESATGEEIRELAKNMGLNPCAEILLDSKGVCNLTTVNVAAFVKDDSIDLFELEKAQRMSARIGLRMTMPTLELPAWDEVQQRDRLLGLSLTGWQDAMAAVGAGPEFQANLLEILKKVARDEADLYADELGVNRPLLVTTVKPEGTLSLVAGGVSPGVHDPFAEYYIRRIRISSHDPVAEGLRASGFDLKPEVGTPGATHEERMENARTVVVEFPVHSPTANRHDSSVQGQLDTYFMFQRNYCEHNASNTISVKSDEWDDASSIVFDGWDDFTAVSFLAHDGGNYELAPYEEITEAQYDMMVALQPMLDVDVVNAFERGEGSELDTADACATGVCPIR
mgnify:FL=1